MTLSKSQKGFSIIELLVVIILLVVFATIITITLSEQGKVATVQQGGQQVLQNLRDAQNRSIAGQDGAQWGLRLESTPSSGPDFVAIIKCPTVCNGSNSVEVSKTVFNTNVELRDVSVDQLVGADCATNCDIVFKNNGSTDNKGTRSDAQTGANDVAVNVWHVGFKVSISVSAGGRIESSKVYNPPGIGNPGTPAECGDGSDNDGDSFTDFPADPGCSPDSNDPTESPNPGWTIVDPGISPASGDLGQIKIFVGSNGMPRIAYVNSSANNASLMFIKCTSLNCVSGNRVGPNPVGITDTKFLSMDKDSADRPHFLSSETPAAGAKIRYFRCLDVDCATGQTSGPTQSSNWLSSTFGAIRIDPSDKPAIAYTSNQSKQGTYYLMSYSLCGAADCTGDPANNLADGRTGTNGFGVSQVFSGSTAMLSYYMCGGACDGTTAERIEFLKCGNATCSSGNTTKDIEFKVDGFGLKVNSDTTGIGVVNGNPRIAYNLTDGSNNKLKVANCPTTDCSTIQPEDFALLVSDATKNPRFPDMAVGSDKKPQIAFIDYQAGVNRGIHYIKCTIDAQDRCNGGTDETIATFNDSDTSAFIYAAIGLYGNNCPYVAWYDNAAQKLKFAYKESCLV